MVYADAFGGSSRAPASPTRRRLRFRSKLADLPFLYSAARCEATLKGVSDEALTKRIEPWIGVLQHSSEHYKLLVAYYRANGLVAPASRK